LQSAEDAGTDPHDILHKKGGAKSYKSHPNQNPKNFFHNLPFILFDSLLIVFLLIGNLI